MKEYLVQLQVNHDGSYEFVKQLLHSFGVCFYISSAKSFYFPSMIEKKGYNNISRTLQTDPFHSGSPQFKTLPNIQSGVIGVRYLVPNQHCTFPSGLFCNIQAALVNMSNTSDFDVSNNFARISVLSFQCELLILLAQDNFSIDVLATCAPWQNSTTNNDTTTWKLSGGYRFLQSARKLIENLILEECPGLMREDNKESVVFLCPMCITESSYFRNGTRNALSCFLSSSLSQIHSIKCNNNHSVSVGQIILGTPVWVRIILLIIWINYIFKANSLEPPKFNPHHSTSSDQGNRQISILSIEGGGPEPLIPFIILEQLEEALRPLKVKRPVPCLCANIVMCSFTSALTLFAVHQWAVS